MTNPWNRIRDYFQRDLWIKRSSLGRPGAFVLGTVRLVVAVIRDVLYGQITLWAMGLVYHSLMSLVPLLAVAFSVLKAFGVQNKLEPFLLDLLNPLGPGGELIAHRIVEFVNNMRVGVLGVVGLGLLMWTVMSLIQKIEQGFNAIWRVRGARSVLRQFSEYLSIVLAGPVLVVSALALTASFMSSSLVRTVTKIQPFGAIVAAAGTLIPYVLVCASFTFLYFYLPNTKVRWGAAALGGLIGGVLWETVGWGFASFIVASTRYAAIYSSFAILILFMTWLYVSWLILLVGCEVSFYYQNPQFLSPAAASAAPNARLVESTAVSIMFLIALHFDRGLERWSALGLAERLGLEQGRVDDILDALLRRRLIVQTADDPPAWLPSRDLDEILVADVYLAVRPTAETGPVPLEREAPEPGERLEQEIDAAISRTLGSRTLKDMVHGVREQEQRAA